MLSVYYLYVQILIQKDVLQLEVSMHNAVLQREQRDVRSCLQFTVKCFLFACKHLTEA